MKKVRTTAMVLFVALLGLNSATAQDEMKLTTIQKEMVVDVTPEKAWEVINSYGDVGSFNSVINSSKSVHGSANEGSMDCERECTIENGKKDLVVAEKIIKYVDGEYYKYTASSEDFPAKHFFNTFGVKVNSMGQTVIYVITEYQMNSGLMTKMAKGKLGKGNVDALLSYKYYMETGMKNGDLKFLRKAHKKA